MLSIKIFIGYNCKHQRSNDGQTSIPSVIDAIIRAQQQLFSPFFFVFFIQLNETKKISTFCKLFQLMLFYCNQTLFFLDILR
jgi:hypothetical protein